MVHFCYVEDYLHQVVVGRVSDYLGRVVPKIIPNGGKSGIINSDKLLRFHRSGNAARFFILVDLDNDSDCAPNEKRRILHRIQGATNLRIIIAVREAESWLLADREKFATYLGVARKHLPSSPEDEADPKRMIINLAEKSRHRDIREAIVPLGTAVQGPRYNTKVGEYVRDHWDIGAAINNSPSLSYMCRVLKENLPPRS